MLLAAALVFAVWESLVPGLDLGTFDSPKKSIAGDSKITVLRIDPAKWQLTLATASMPGEGKTRTAKEWAARKGFTAAINPSMFKDDHSKSVSLMRTRAHVNNAKLTADKSILAFDSLDAKAAKPARLLDRDCDSFDALEKTWGGLVQSIRMVSCKRKNVWSQQPKIWSHAAIGEDGAGNILFVHARSPWSTHDFIDTLLALPIDLQRLQYSEGGPEATLYVKSGTREIELVGSYETGFNENDDNTRAWALPNVLGIVPR